MSSSRRCFTSATIILVCSLVPLGLPALNRSQPAYAAAGDAVTLYPPGVLHSNGAELHWSRYVGASGTPFDHYEVHRSATASFTPSPATLLTTIRDIDTTTYVDTAARASTALSYRIVVNAGDVSNEQRVTLPADLQAQTTLQPVAAEAKASYISFGSAITTTCYPYNNYGAATNLRVGSATNTVVHRPLLRFDLRRIPAGSTITDARLTLSYNANSATPGQIEARRVTRDWAEGTAAYPGSCNGSGVDWREARAGVPWTTAGGDYTSTVEGSVPAKTRSAAGTDTYVLTNLVQNWVSGTYPNLGLLLRLTNESIPTSGSKYFDYLSDDVDSDLTSASRRPKLVVKYTDNSHASGPRAAVSSPGPLTRVSGSTVPLSATATDDGRVTSVEFYRDGGTLLGSDNAEPWTTTWDSTAVPNGVHSLYVKAYDDAGNVTQSSSTNVTVDNTAPPTASVSAPATVSGTATVTATATDDVGVTKVEFYADGNRFGTDPTAPYSAPWNTLDLLDTAYDGQHTLTVRAYDTSGQVTISAGRTVTVDNTSLTKYSASFDLNAPGPDDDVIPQLMTANVSAPAQDPYSGGGRNLGSGPVDSTGASTPSAATTSSTSCPSDSYCPTVTVTNTSGISWKGGELRVWYRWYAPNGAILFEGPANDNFPNVVQPGQSKTLPLVIRPPAMPPGASLGDYRLRLDIYDTDASALVPNPIWFSEEGNHPIDNPVIVAKGLRSALGLEKYFQYEGESAGGGMQAMSNVANGNNLLRWTPWTDPGRGLSTVLDVTYNSLEDHSESPLGNNFSLAISGLTRLGIGLDIHPNKADDISGNARKWVKLIDGDGTPHQFDGTTNPDGSTTWTAPPGVFLYLRHFSDTDPDRAWAVSRPDHVTFFFTEDGFPTQIVDKNNNTLRFTLQDTPSGEDPGGPKKRVTAITDPGGRAFTITHYSKDEAKQAHVRGKIKRITDHSGHALDFEYYEDGNLLRITQRGGSTATGDFLPDRTIVFTYTDSSGAGPAIPAAADRVDPDPATHDQSTRLYSVRDPNGHETTFSYFGPSDGAQLRWRLKDRTNRVLGKTSFSYDLNSQVTTVTAPLSRTTGYGYDTDGKPISITNAKGETTTLLWDDVTFQLTTITDPNQATRTYTYNANGYITSITDQENDRTDLTYQDRPLDGTDAGTHWSLLATRTSPEGTATPTVGDFQWTFGYDAAGNLTTVTEPGPEQYTTRLCWNLAVAPACNIANEATAPGTLHSVTDADGRPPVVYSDYDPNGMAQLVTDGRGGRTRLGYDPDALPLWLQDAAHADDTGADVRSYRNYFDYDSFRRLGRQSSPRSTRLQRGLLIWSAASYDANDNILTNEQPTSGYGYPGTGPKVSFSYEAMDHRSQVTNPDKSADPAGERTHYDYDAAGRLQVVTLPLGMKSGIAKDHQVFNTYDPLDRVVQQTRYQVDSAGTVQQTRNSFRCYDNVGNLVASVAPNAALTQAPACPPSGVPSTTTYSYDKAHRIRTTTDALGHQKAVSYNRDGKIVTETDANNRTTRYAYNERDLPIRITEPFTSDAQGNVTRALVTIYAYDGVGNQTKVISPRAYDASTDKQTFSDYVTSYDYDATGMISRVTLPSDASTPATYVHYYYDPLGRPTASSLPVTQPDPSLVTATAKTTYSYFDPGWVRTSKDPANPTVHFDYTAQGQQAERVPESKSAPGTLDQTLAMTWTYYPDGKLKARADQTAQLATYGYDADNNLARTASVHGVTDPTQGQLETLATYNGFDEVTKTRQKKLADANYTFTSYGYDRDGNVTSRNDNGQETPAGSQTVAPSRNVFVYDGADWLTTQFEYGTATTCTGDQRVDNTFTPTGWEATRKVNRASATCTAESTATYDLKQQTAWTYFDNGKLKTLTTTNSGNATLESHVVGYETAGVYVNGNRTSDQYLLKGPGSTACNVSTCTATYSYDARDKLTRSTDGHGGTTTYTLDGSGLSDPTIKAGNVTSMTGPTGTTTSTYTGNQLTSTTSAGVTSKYWYDNLGRLDCVTTSTGTAANCSPSDGGTASSTLLADYQYDDLGRLAAYRKYGAGTKTDSATYTYDALDRVGKEVETHASLTTGSRTTTFTYQGLTNLSVTEKQTNSGNADTDTKTYSYDTYGHRIGVLDSKVASGVTTTTRSTYGYDVHGNVSLLVNEGTGAASACYGYTDYGDTDTTLSKGDTNKISPINPYRYDAKRYDSGSGTIDMGSRRFGPDTGRFLQQDVLSGALGDLGLGLDPLTQNRYSLAGGNPLSFVEVDGHMPIADGGGGAAPTPAPASAPTKSTQRTGSDCAEKLDCSVEDFNRMSVSQRTSFVRSFEKRYGAEYNIDNWFANVRGVLRFLRDDDEGKPNTWTSWVDSSILHGFERGMAIVKGRGGSMGNPGADKWAKFFSYSKSRPNQDSNEKRKLWSEAEEASTWHGYAVATAHATFPVPSQLAFALAGEGYRLALRHMDVVRPAARGVGIAGCSMSPLVVFADKCGDLAEQAVQDLLSPQTLSPSWYGAHAFHGFGTAVEGVATLNPVQFGQGAVEVAEYGGRGVVEAAGWLWNHL